MIPVEQKLLTAEEFFEIAALPENESKRLELEDGVMVETAPSMPLKSVVAGRIGYFLNAFVIPRNLGYVTGADGGFKFSAHRARQPDAGFISKARQPTLPREFKIAPDLAVEVVSENKDVFKKANEYFRAGTKVVWAVYAVERTVYVMRLNEDGAIVSLPFTQTDTLDGGDVLPGFTLAVKDIFPA